MRVAPPTQPRNDQVLHQCNSSKSCHFQRHNEASSNRAGYNCQDLNLKTLVMAVRLLESRFESLTVNDENEPPVNNGPIYHKSKVRNSANQFNAKK